MTHKGRDMRNHFISSIDLANTVLKEHFHAGRRDRPSVMKLLAQVYAVELAFAGAHGTSITGDLFEDRGDGLGPTTATLRAKFAQMTPEDVVERYIPVADGSAFTIRDRTVVNIVRDVLADR